MKFKKTVLIKGGGDLGSGTAYRLKKCGFDVFITEQLQPTFIRRYVSFGEAVYSKKIFIEDIEGILVNDYNELLELIKEENKIPVIVDNKADIINEIKPDILIDATMEKNNDSTNNTLVGQAGLVIGLGPGFTAGKDVDIVIETNRGHYLGRVIIEGTAEKDTGIPGNVRGESIKRIIKSSIEGNVNFTKKIGDLVKEGEVIGTINDENIIVKISGVIRGLIKNDIFVPKDAKIGDIDTSCNVQYCYTISDKSLAIAGGVIQAILSHI